MNDNKISLTEKETFKSIEIPKIFDKLYNKKYNKQYFIPNKIKNENKNIRNLLISSIDRNLFFEKPLTLKNFETSLKTFFFGKNGKFTKFIPNLNKEYKEMVNLKEKQKKNNLNIKNQNNESINNISDIKKDNFNHDSNKKRNKKILSKLRMYHSISPPSKILFSEYSKNNDENKNKKKDVKFFISSLNNTSYSLYQKQASNMNSISNNNTFYHQKNNFSDNLRQNSFFSNNNSFYNDITNVTNLSNTIKNNSTNKKNKSFYRYILIKRNLEKNKINFLNNMKKSNFNLKNKLDIIYNREKLLSDNILKIIDNNKTSERSNRGFSFDYNNLYNLEELNNDLGSDYDLKKVNEKKKIINTIRENIDDKDVLKIVKRKDIQAGKNFDDHVIIKLKRYLILKEQMNNYKVNKRINNNLIDMKKIAYKIEQIKDKIKKKEEDKKIKNLMKQIKSIE